MLLILYAVLVGAASFRVARRLRGPQDFLTGGGDLGTIHGLGLLGGIFLAGTAVGVVGESYVLGWPGAWLDVALGLGFAVLLFTLLGRLRASGHLSVASLLRDSFGGPAGVIAAITAGVSWLVLLAAFISAAARALDGLMGWGPSLSILATVAVLMLYAMPGGMRAVASTNMAQLVVLGLLLVWVAVATSGMEATVATSASAGIPFGYIIGLTLLSTPTTVVAPDVVLGIGSARGLQVARRMVALISLCLVGGGFFLALLGIRARGLVEVVEAEQALPALIDLVLPVPVAATGLILLFGASLAGAVSELMVCTYLLNSGLRERGKERPSLASIRLQMAAAGVAAAVLALVHPFVVEMVLIAFRLFVPAVVPQVVAALLRVPIRRGAVLASMVLGPAISTSLWMLNPGTAMTAFDPVLWGVLAAVAALLAGRRVENREPSSSA